MTILNKSYQPVLSAGSLVGDKVLNVNGDDLGKIEELMFDVDTGRIEYAVLSFGGFLGLGDKYFAIPWSAMEVNLEEKCMVLNIPKERLKNAKGFDKDNWPNMADHTWAAELRNQYGL